MTPRDRFKKRFLAGFLSFALVLVLLNVAVQRMVLRTEHAPLVALALVLSASMWGVRLFAELCGDWRRLRESIRKFLADPLGLADW